MEKTQCLQQYFEQWITVVVYFDQRMHACMRSHGRKQSKTFENHEKSIFFIMQTRGSRNAHEEKRRKMKKKVIISFTCGAHVEKSTKTPKFQMGNQL